MHIVGAWASEHVLALGQVALDSKIDEIKAIPYLLELLDLHGAIVAIDAMGYQREIAKQIIEAGGDYIFAVKDNHPKLSGAISQYFIDAHEQGLVESGVRSKSDRAITRGRFEDRFYAVTSVPDSMREVTTQWPGAKNIGQAITTIKKDDPTSVEVRYFLCSRDARVKEFSKSARSNWSIESMHWVLDMVFHEDNSRVRTGHAIENMSFTRRFVTSLLKRSHFQGQFEREAKKGCMEHRLSRKTPIRSQFLM